MSIEHTEILRLKMQASLDLLIKKIGKIQIGTKEQFPLGWRNAGKGRTVWRIIEEVIIQNLEKYYSELDIIRVTVAETETTIYDFSAVFKGEESPVYVNIKSAVSGGKTQKDDISKGLGLQKFYEADINRDFYVATFFISFNDDMSLSIEKCIVFPIAWVPDVYINPSNNGNLQSSKYKNLDLAAKRTTQEFYNALIIAMEKALQAKHKKLNVKSLDAE